MTQLATRCERLTPSPIRDILHVLSQPDMISFAGGLPSEESFPSIDPGEIPRSYLQYGESEGDEELREAIAVELTQRGLATSAENVLVLSGSQQGIDLVAKLLIEENTHVAVESPCYLAALQVFSLFGARYTAYQPQSLNTLLKSDNPNLIYCTPTFQNPTGYCYDPQQRVQLANICQQHGSVFFEDDPYHDLCFESCQRVPICAHIADGDWIYQSSFSKIMAPGLRLGYLTASKHLFPHLVKLKQAADLHSNRLSQYIALSLLNDPQRELRLEKVIAQYKSKRAHFDNTLKLYFSELADWRVPVGGLFFWLRLKNPTIDTNQLMQQALAEKVAFMPGKPFYPEVGDRRTPDNMLRLNFSLASPEEMELGLAKLAAIIHAADQAGQHKLG